MKDLIKVACKTAPWAPAGVENVWCIRLPNGTVEINNIPWFAENVNLGDRFKTIEKQGRWWLGDAVQRSGHRTLPLVFRHSMTNDQWREALAEVRATGVLAEAAFPGFASISIPPDIDKSPFEMWMKRAIAEKRIDEP